MKDISILAKLKKFEFIGMKFNIEDLKEFSSDKIFA